MCKTSYAIQNYFHTAVQSRRLSGKREIINSPSNMLSRKRGSCYREIDVVRIAAIGKVIFGRQEENHENELNFKMLLARRRYCCKPYTF